MPDTESTERAPRRLRSDAQRNVDAVRAAAKAVFAEAGVDAPMRQIASRAGVGVGTIYRHFPQRSDLVVAVFRHEVDACADAAPTLAAEYPPGEALTRWLRRYLDFIAAKRGLHTALHSGDPAFDPLPTYFSERLRPALGALLDAAAATGEVRPDVDPTELLHAIAMLSVPGNADGPEKGQRMVELLLDGLRYGSRA
ncbi:TetR/AcrR family transcriptional regulator [Solicola gregarius]|uniref:TetR/AcrR family transcriptional regulator n=1 Tax=Solicola gregarius TaxID=2908642 RepID=A0AA46TJ05_9ACTN|nr:TetR/AcrR family transcriptional regulator [Solicola gregarius]UYM06196.1 TetR/AcrR family transcriptional regulator [Solicola gregarius]